MNNPYESPSFESNPAFGSDGSALKADGPSGMVQQVRVLIILNAVQGGLEIVMAVFMLIYSIMIPFMLKNNPEFQEQINNQPNPPAEGLLMGVAIGVGVVAFALLLAGVLRTVAGVRNWKFRGRSLGIVSVTVGMLSAFGCYCAPTGIALLVYGLIVYLNPSVKRAFQMGENGMRGDRILHEFSTFRQD